MGRRKRNKRKIALLTTTVALCALQGASAGKQRHRRAGCESGSSAGMNGGSATLLSERLNKKTAMSTK